MTSLYARALFLAKHTHKLHTYDISTYMWQWHHSNIACSVPLAGLFAGPSLRGSAPQNAPRRAPQKILPRKNPNLDSQIPPSCFGDFCPAVLWLKCLIQMFWLESLILLSSKVFQSWYGRVKIAEASWEEFGSPEVGFLRDSVFCGALRGAFCGAEPHRL